MYARLKAIVDDRREAIERTDFSSLPTGSGAARRDFRAALMTRSRSIIAEIKRRSPSAGALREQIDAAALARSYETAGAAALSVLTEEAHFGGSLEDLIAARDAVSIPVLRKDFILDRRQLRETKVCGADAVLLIARILEDQLGGFVDEALELGVEPLVEVHDASDLAYALATRCRVIGVNNRDLDSFTIDLTTSLRLLPSIPNNRLRIVESGLRSVEDLETMERAGFDAALIGSALVTADHPEAALAQLTQVAS